MIPHSRHVGRIAICVPSGTMVHADFALCLATMVHSLADFSLGFISAKSAIVADARNMGVAFAEEIGAESILFIDSDMIFPRDALLRLLRHDRDIVGASYSRRTPPLHALGEVSAVQPAVRSPDLLLMNRLPTGFLLVRMTVFAALRRPYFRFVGDERSGTNISEDYDFCDRVRGVGFEIWCDRTLTAELGHIGQHVFTTTI